MLAVRVALALALVVGLQPAARSTEVTLSPSPTQRCLTPAAAERGTPTYPEDEWRRGQAGRVQVELIFTTPDLRPEIKVLASQGSPAFVDAVREHVTALRVPCLEYADIPARVQLDYVFAPTQRDTTSAAPVDPADAERRRMLGCLVSPARPPVYPMDARRRVAQGRLLVEMSFTGADAPPTVKVLARPGSKVFLESARDWASGHRIPCHQGAPVQMQAMLIFTMEGEDRYGFKPLSLRQFIGGMRDIAQQRVFFDFALMACPFSVRLTYLQPLAPSVVTEVQPKLLAREPFLAWLAAAKLNLPDAALDAVFGDSLVLDVPCGKIDLSPQPSSPNTPSTQEKS